MFVGYSVSLICSSQFSRFFFCVEFKGCHIFSGTMAIAKPSVVISTTR
ncbi:hypothetical protein EVA_20575 [gut metagenome]|uniref:Uncharacterized protein n=1 Tax=gut metagenome TaxID=749906 RepID=J9FA53_9ZZZZ